MTILGPLLFAGLTLAPTYFATLQDHEIKRIAVVDSSHLFTGKIANTELLQFDYKANVPIEKMKKSYKDEGYYAVLYIPHIVVNTPSAVELFSEKEPAWSIKEHISNSLGKELETQKMLSYNIDNLDSILRTVKTRVEVRCIELSDGGTEKERNTTLNMIVGYISGLLIYFFVFLFGSQVMRGVIEEKTNRIIEVIVSSVKPFELMMGKIVGIAMVGLTQFIIWVLLTIGIVIFSQKIFFPELSKTPTEQVVSQDLMKSNTITNSDASQPAATINTGETQEQTSEVKAVFDSFKMLNLSVLICSFLFFFLGGYLLYASLFAAIGSAVDNETDTQQFMLPVTIPLILAIIVMPNVIQNPDGALAYWFSIIPLTSPMVMMMRIPFGVPWVDVILSAVLLIVAFVFTTWMAGKIYRTGILMYGKKSDYREIWKWLKYRN
jgi:ABC-2 type transport system permease protein